MAGPISEEGVMNQIFRFVFAAVVLATGYGYIVSPGNRLSLYNTQLNWLSGLWSKTEPSSYPIIFGTIAALLLAWLWAERVAAVRTQLNDRAQRIALLLGQLNRSSYGLGDGLNRVAIEPMQAIGTLERNIDAQKGIVAQAEEMLSDPAFLTRLAEIRRSQQGMATRISALKTHAAARDLASLADRQKELGKGIDALENDDDGSLQDRAVTLQNFVAEVSVRLDTIDRLNGELRQLQARIAEYTARAEALANNKTGVPKLVEQLTEQKDALSSTLDDVENLDDGDLKDTVDKLKTDCDEIQERLGKVVIEVGRMNEISAAFAALAAKFGNGNAAAG
ncbi:MAG: hypothetical protein AAB919_02455 [Patescibacteria group bacterium]